MIAALFVDEIGPYSEMPGVDVWGVSRDARGYSGPHPVVAHPPCHRWCALAKAVFGRYQREELRPGNDGGCFASALASVRKFGGVLEHPAKSLAWGHFGLIRPPTSPARGWVQAATHEWVCEVWQQAYGHLAAKATWLLYCGNNPPRELDWSRRPGTHQIGFQDKRGKCRNKPTISGRKASLTPLAFADALIDLARHSGGLND